MSVISDEKPASMESSRLLKMDTTDIAKIIWKMQFTQITETFESKKVNKMSYKTCIFEIGKYDYKLYRIFVII